MTLIHSKDYVLKIARELNYTIEDVRSQVSRWVISRDLDGNLSTKEAIFFLRLFYVDDIRFILTFKEGEKKTETTDIIEVIQNELNIKLYPMSDYYTSKNYMVYLREYRQSVFVVYTLTKKDIDIKISKTIRTEKDLSNLIKIIKKVKELK